MSSTQDRTVTVERLIRAPAGDVFAVLASPARHSALDGGGTVDGAPSGPDPLHLGARFTMAMRQGPFRYRSVNEVTVFHPDREIAWRTTGEWRGHTVVGGQWWRYELVPRDGGTLVRHSYEWGRARFPVLTIRLPGYPARMALTMPESLRRLDEAVLDAG
ncbi:hypothetical protein DQ239_06800 [Blastococcus sp. TF02-09]|uniref:SRPBCC family protein n=1 Tax=Blastococcus sp. TF02-09 TaxID=2250576 RepID=UPI000DE8A820|nr:SRPBCC family protein [Blastococcus sp. TF02-9]RBY79337.1 hypothetical protein DQ239_06800 [Blastococcus sp. TF02-9]